MLATLINTITVWFGTMGYWGVFIACVGIFPAEIVIAMVAAKMPNNLIEISAIAALGEVVGAVLTYLIGMFFSKREILKFVNGKGKFLKVSEDSYKNGEKEIKKNGIGYLFISRFIPTIRTVSGLVAGYVKYNIFSFLVVAFLGTFIYAYAFAYLGAKIGFNWEKIEGILDAYNNIALVLTIVGVVIYFFVRRKREKKDSK